VVHVFEVPKFAAEVLFHNDPVSHTLTPVYVNLFVTVRGQASAAVDASKRLGGSDVPGIEQSCIVHLA
jgi:hypothetical protein